MESLASPALRAPAARRFAYGAESPLRMIAMAYPVLILGDQAVAMACIPARFVVAHVAVLLLGVYGFVWLVRVVRSMRARPHTIDERVAVLHRGSLGSARVCLGDVVSASRIEPEAIARLARHADRAERPGRLDLGGERVLVTLRAPVKLEGAYGSKSARSLLVSADDPAALIAALTASAA